MSQRMHTTSAWPKVRYGNPIHPKLCLQSFLPGQRGQVTHEALLAAGFALCYLMPGRTMLGTNQLKHTTLRLALGTETNTTCDTESNK